MRVKEIPFSELLCEIIDNRGKTCPTVEAGIPLIATNCIRNELLYPTYEKARFVSQHTYASWFRGHPKPGDILFVNKATPGRVCLVPDPVDFCIAQDMVAVRADPNKIYPKFLFAVLRSPTVQEKIVQLHVGSLIPHFKKGDFDKLLLPVPSRGAQEFIGDIHFDLYAKIDLNRRMNETLEAMARAIFKSWFLDFDPVRAKAEGCDTGLPKEIAGLFPDSFEDSELGEVPKEWDAGTLADYAELNPESWSKDTYPEVIEYVDLANTKWGKIDATTKYSRDDAPSRAQRILRNGDTIIGTVRPGNGSYAQVADEGLTGSTGFAVLRPRSESYQDLVYLASTDPTNIERLAHLADGAADPAVRPDVVLASNISKASDPVIKCFSDLARPLFVMIAHNERQSNTIATLRETLLPKLISGAVRVNEAKRSMEEVGF
jgi:type I restriction enzyme, S subunit